MAITTIVAILAHPDDTDTYCSNFLKGLVVAGKAVHLVSFTRGEHGLGATSDPKKEEFRGKRLGRLRSAELVHAAGYLGIPRENVTFLDIEDSHVWERRHEAFRKVLCMLGERQPGLVLLPEFARGYYRHPDHVCAGMLAFLALKRLGYAGKLMLYHSISNNYYHPASKDVTTGAIRLHKTQAEFFRFIYPVYSNIEQIKNGMHLRGSMRAEGYRITSVAESQPPSLLSIITGKFFGQPRLLTGAPRD